jgi:hypothetical protein
MQGLKTALDTERKLEILAMLPKRELYDDSKRVGKV